MVLDQGDLFGFMVSYADCPAFQISPEADVDEGVRLLDTFPYEVR